MQEANYTEFLSYINQGEDTKLTITNDNREELALQTYSMGKLLQLLVINTLGLVVNVFSKLYYSTRYKFKRPFIQNNNVNRSNLKERMI